jgi:hypothetical protein
LPNGDSFNPKDFEPSDLTKSSGDFDKFTLPATGDTDLQSGGGTTAEKLQFREGAGQWLRKINLSVFNTSGGKGEGLDLSQFRIDFRLTKQTNQSPNFLDAKVYNLSKESGEKVRQFKKVQLSAGYQSNFGMIFDGTVVLYIVGKENSVDSYVNIIAGDGDQEINNSISNLTFAPGVLEEEQVRTAITKSGRKVGEINMGEEKGQKTLRSSHYLGTTERFLRNHMNARDADLFMDDGKAYVISRAGYRKGEVVKLAPNTGLVGFPKVTPSGIEAQCLLNPKLRIAGQVEIDTTLLTGVAYQPGVENPFSSAGTQKFDATGKFGWQGASTSPTGKYKILLMTHHGDTRGNPWYTDIVCTAVGLVNAPGTALKRTAIGPGSGGGSSGDTDLGAGGR